MVYGDDVRNVMTAERGGGGKRCHFGVIIIILTTRPRSLHLYIGVAAVLYINKAAEYFGDNQTDLHIRGTNLVINGRGIADAPPPPRPPATPHPLTYTRQ